MCEGLKLNASAPLDLLVFGATGAIGKTLLEKSKNSGLSALGVSRDEHNDPQIISIDYKPSSILEILMTSSPKQIAISLGTVSSNPNVDSSLIDDEIRSVKSTLTAIEQANLFSHVSLISSSAVYGNTEKNSSSENDILNPISKYGELKAKIEDLALESSKNSTFTLDVLRVFSVYGKEQKKLMIWDMFERIQKCNEDELKIKASPKSKRNYTSV
jgi:UDP-glucose 4-epimerase